MSVGRGGGGGAGGGGVAECQPGLLAGCGKVNGGGKTSYCVTLERTEECRPSVSSGLPYPQSKWTRASRGEATDTHRAKPTEHSAVTAALTFHLARLHVCASTAHSVKTFTMPSGLGLGALWNVPQLLLIGFRVEGEEEEEEEEEEEVPARLTLQCEHRFSTTTSAAAAATTPPSIHPPPGAENTLPAPSRHSCQTDPPKF
ncbi:unnamed protein product [Merluccius merluccius]